MKRFLLYFLFTLLDHVVWLMIQITPGHVLIKLIQKRPWKRFEQKLLPKVQEKWQSRIARILRIRCSNAGWGSTCLSRSLSGRLLMDLIGVPNELYLGMGKCSDGSKIPHAWLVGSNKNQLFTPGLVPSLGVELIEL